MDKIDWTKPVEHEASGVEVEVVHVRKNGSAVVIFPKKGAAYERAMLVTPADFDMYRNVQPERWVLVARRGDAHRLCGVYPSERLALAARGSVQWRQWWPRFTVGKIEDVREESYDEGESYD
jgi:hypothetical protein